MSKKFDALKKVFPYPDQFGQLLGYQVLEIEAGHARTTIQIEEKHLSPSGKMHGGVLSAFADFSMGCALFLALPKGYACSTIE
ncbi:MAG: PaaI family thioesterase, partial [Deltaproteobacteria bacterium]|nr:PaaI family thioesterase [Deltaproteobacteria bacterium]